MAPMHVVNEYCSNSNFEPHPPFDEQPRLSYGAGRFYNCLSDDWEDWFAPHSGLGRDFAISKGEQFSSFGTANAKFDETGDLLDIYALTTLCKQRKQDFKALAKELKSLLQVEEKPSFSI